LRSKLVLLALATVALAGALTLAAFATPDRGSRAAARYLPRGASLVIARVAPRDPDELRARRALAASPDRVELAVELARRDILRARTLSDPRYLGRAQATLAQWWALPAPPPDVMLLRATIEQSLHAFVAARADLDALIAARPDDVQAQLTRAVVATVMGDYPAARASCTAVMRRASSLVAAACRAPLDGIAGHAEPAYRMLAAELQAARGDDPAIASWALTVLAELAIQRGEMTAAGTHLQQVLAFDGEDHYARGLLADVLLAQDRAGDASALLAGREQIDGLLVRRAIAEHRARGSEATELADRMRTRIAAARERGDRVHLREEARFALDVEAAPSRALQLAREDWAVQHELADARLLAEVALAARAASAAAPVVAWAAQTGVHDAQLDRFLRRLGAS
jgi:hypothetical protein